MQGGERYNSINDYLKSEFGRKTVKLSIDAGFTCPNRDGTKGYGGCAFCSEGGSGELASHLNFNTEDSSAAHDSHYNSFPKGSSAASTLHYSFNSEGESAEHTSGFSFNPGSIYEALDAHMKASVTSQIDKLSAKWPNAAYIAYFQSFTNTYAPVEALRDLYYAALNDSRISGIAIATRPDCLPDDVLDLLDEINRDRFMWVELGLQTIHETTQDKMNLCYTTADYDRAAAKLSARGIRFVTHLILGLPGETEEMMLDSIRYVCRSPEYARQIAEHDRHAAKTCIPAAPFGLKLHLMNIVKTSPLYKAMPDYVPFDTLEDYVDLVVRCLEIIPPDITIHRLTGDVPRRILVSPEWSYRKRTILNAINRELALRNTFQGINCKL